MGNHSTVVFTWLTTYIFIIFNVGLSRKGRTPTPFFLILGLLVIKIKKKNRIV